LTIHPWFFSSIKESKKQVCFPKNNSRKGGEAERQVIDRMSAYMVNDETINRVVYWLYWEVMNYQWLRDKLEKVSGIDTTTYAWSAALGKAMFDLNIAGVNDRYKGGEAGKFRPLDYHYTPAYGSPVQVLKSLQCWLYQCTEGDVVTKPLYKFFQDTVEPYIMSRIIADLPEYRAAEWG
jgi:hypothetical protein